MTKAFRISHLDGQMTMDFSLPEQPSSPTDQITIGESTSLPPSTQVVYPATLTSKNRVRRIPNFPSPSVSLHKAGRRILVKPNDLLASVILEEVKDRCESMKLRDASYYSPNLKGYLDARKSSYIHEHLASPSILNTILKQYGVDTHTSDTLAGYIRRESKRSTLEITPLPFVSVEPGVSLLDRCCEGTVLKCIKDYTQAECKFETGKRYLVVSTGGGSRDSVGISSTSVESRADRTSKDTVEWTMFSPPMEEHFTDSEDHEIGPTIDQVYPERVAEMRRRLDKLNLPLFEHVASDVAMLALYRGVINAYPMRFGKSSSAISWALLRGHKKVAVIGPKNAVISISGELNRMGMKKDLDYAVVNKLSDITESSAKFFLMRSTWLWRPAKHQKASRNPDPAVKDRSSKTKGLLRTIQFGEGGKVEDAVNTCPHCASPLYRLVRVSDAAQITTEHVVFKAAGGFREFYVWTTARGYKCRNADCKYTTKALGGLRGQRHSGGFIDYELMAHANCVDRGRGRICNSCKVPDGYWAPGQYKRIKNLFTCVIADEVHDNKDRNSLRAKALYSMRARARMSLTGTLVGNSVMDTYWPLHWTLNAPNSRFPYSGASGAKEFDARFCDFANLDKTITETTEDGKTVSVIKTVRKRIPFLKHPADWWKFISNKVLRRTYEDPVFLESLRKGGRSMPRIDINRFPCPMDRYQAEIMLAALKDFRGQFTKMIEAAKTKNHEVNPSLVVAQMATLRSVATCPEILNVKIGPDTYKGQAGGGKMLHIRLLADDVVKNGGKFLVLSDLIQMQKTATEVLGAKYRVLRFNTAWNEEERQEAFEKFRGPDYDGMVAGTRAISCSVDLSADGNCNTVICTDMLWNPVLQRQAWSRAATPSPIKRTIKTYLMTSLNSIDEHIYNVFYSKMAASDQAMDKRAVNRRAQVFDVKWFVDRVLEEEEAISDYLSEMQEGEASGTMTVNLLEGLDFDRSMDDDA